jgi:hypothetical protein
MAAVEILPAINPDKIPKAHHKTLPVPVIPLPKEHKHTPPAVPTHPAGKAPKTKIPIGYTRPILSHHTPIIDRAYMG